MHYELVYFHSALKLHTKNTDHNNRLFVVIRNFFVTIFHVLQSKNGSFMVDINKLRVVYYSKIEVCFLRSPVHEKI